MDGIIEIIGSIFDVLFQKELLGIPLGVWGISGFVLSIVFSFITGKKGDKS